MTRTWDDEDCPRDDCDGDLEQQDALNVMCLNCEQVWTHYLSDEQHKLVRSENITDATLPREDT